MTSTLVPGVDDDHHAVIYLPRDVLAAETLEQVARIIKHPSVSRARVMPDCHPGAGCCVGFTCHVNDLCVSPSIVGGDIGCGITALPMKAKVLSSDKTIAKVQRAFRQQVPTGNGHTGVHASPVADDAFIDLVLAHASLSLPRLATRLEGSPSVATLVPSVLDRAWLNDRLKAWGVNAAMVKQHSGTLGGGNHFFELDGLQDSTASSSQPPALLVVHSGSRYVGRCVYRYWMQRAIASSVKAEEGVSVTSELHKDDDALDDDFEVDNAVAVSAEVALRGADAIGYLIDMTFAQAFAAENRRLILSLVAFQLGNSVVALPSTNGEDAVGDDGEEEDPLEALLRRRNEAADDDDDDQGMRRATTTASSAEDGGSPDWSWLLPWEALINSTHNYIDVQGGVLRKGAVEAKEGQACIIAQNMRDGVWLCRGRGNPEWNWSAPHGTGRVVTRSSANAAAGGSKKNNEAALSKFRKEMTGVVSDSVTIANIDERPSVYRESSLVRDHMGDAVDVMAHYKVVLSCK